MAKLLKAKEGGENVQLSLASNTLGRTLRALSVSAASNVLSAACLKDIGGIRAALDVVSTYLSDDFAQNIKNSEKLRECLESAKHLCCNSSQSVIQLYLLKLLVHHDPNGIDAVKEKCKTKELDWILPPQLEV